MIELEPGDVLSYSAGSTQTGPYGFRKVRPKAANPADAKQSRGPMLDLAVRHWPELLDVLGERSILFINVYPATIGVSPHAISVDTYLSPRVLTRALKLGRAADHPVIILAQSLFIADAFLKHLAAGHELPETLMLWVGGYVTPRSLEEAVEAMVAPHVERFVMVQYFGAAEVEAGCMVARERDEDGQLIYLPRDTLKPEVEGENLLLSLYTENGEPIIERFPTGDLARRSGGGWALWNPRRLHPAVEAELESWSTADWRRRTGYVRRDGDTIRIQLREGEAPETEAELEHFDFARRFGFSWLEKPYWR